MSAGLVRCRSCGRSYKTADGMPDFRHTDSYWCNVSRDKMRLLNRMAEESGDWFGAAAAVVPEYKAHFVDFVRADSQLLFPIGKDARVLDAGSMWGGISVPLARNTGEVYAVDKTAETLSFLDIRARQMGLKNIHTVLADLNELPFSDGYFDLVVLSGVLEWVAQEEDIVLEKGWNGKLVSGEQKRSGRDPLQVQIKVLKELKRVIKPGGNLYLAIENRSGYQYLTGYPDDHVNVKFVTFLPRPVADIITRIVRGCSYRTYIYGHRGLRNILKRAGYGTAKFYGAFPHYMAPRSIVPFNLIKRLKNKIAAGGGRRLAVAAKLIPAGLMKFFSPSIIVMAQKGEDLLQEARIIRLIKKLGIIDEKDVNKEAVLLNNKIDNRSLMHYLIYDPTEGRAVLFCKICRTMEQKPLLEEEARNLSEIETIYSGSRILTRMPKLLYCGEVEGIYLMVTNYIDCSKFDLEQINRSNFADLDKAIKQSINFLIEFQHLSEGKDSTMGEYFYKLAALSERAGLADDPKTRVCIQTLSKAVEEVKDVKFKLCAVHGDFDFYHNVMHRRGEVYVVDFENFRREGLPLYDPAMLIFNPFLLSYKKSSGDFVLFLKKNGAKKFIREWFDYYIRKKGLSKRAGSVLLKMALMEQALREYPHREKKAFMLADIEVTRDLIGSDLTDV